MLAPGQLATDMMNQAASPTDPISRALKRLISAPPTILLILISGAVLRFWDLRSRSLWFDEAVSFLIGNRTLTEAVRAAVAEGHPPLYNLALSGFLHVFQGEAAARAFSALLATATLPLVYLIGRRLAGRGPALVATLLLAISPFHLWYAQEIRMYALQTLLVAASFLFFLGLLEPDHGPAAPKSERTLIKISPFWSIVLYTIFSAAMLLVQYTSLAALLAQNLFFIVFWKRHRPRLKAWLIAQASALILFAFWLPTFFAHLSTRTSGFWLAPLTANNLLSHMLNFTGGLQSGFSLNNALAWVGLGLLLLGAAVVLLTQRLRYAGVFLLCWFLVPTIGLALFSLNANIFLSRALLFTLPAFCLLAALAMPASVALWSGPGGRLIAGGLLLGLLVVNILGLVHYFTEDNWWLRSPHRGNAERIGRLCGSDDLVVHVSRFTYRPYQVYLGDRCSSGLIAETENLPDLFTVIGSSDLPQDLSGFKRIWLVGYQDFQQPEATAKLVGWLDQNHQRAKVIYADRLNLVALYNISGGPLLPGYRP